MSSPINRRPIAKSPADASGGVGADLPLRLFYYDGFPNFGDRITHDIVAKVSGRPVVATPSWGADLFALGSIMHFVAKITKNPHPVMAPAVWGCGIMGLIGPNIRVEHIHFAAVRGPLTQTLIDMPHLTIGDPGLLITDVVSSEPRGDKIGILCHVSDKPNADVVARLQDDGRFCFIDVGTEDHLGTVRAISSCAHIISSSLHGLIVADSFGVPNSWMVNSRIHSAGAFKFHDYALSVHRLLNRPFALEDVLMLADSGAFAAGEPAHFANVEALKGPLRAAFPHDYLLARSAAMAQHERDK